MKILFVLKYRQGYGDKDRYFSSGLYWSARFVSDMLNELGVCARLVQVTDNNDIDREVSLFKPDIVIIEALWVVPEKFDILKKLHPDVYWVVRLHSNLSFLASEGIAIDWINGYLSRDVAVASNSRQAADDLGVFYLPNYYPVRHDQHFKQRSEEINIACYGAIRPLKNQLSQAVAAIEFAESIDKHLNFFINSSRVETHGEPILKNIRGLFKDLDHTLVESSWKNHDDFLDELRNIDIGMQVSLSETFCIVAADMVSVGVPIVVSPEVKWASRSSKVDPTNVDGIVRGLARAYQYPRINSLWNRRNLRLFSEESRYIWKDL